MVKNMNSDDGIKKESFICQTCEVVLFGSDKVQEHHEINKHHVFKGKKYIIGFA
jgi:hypothetical protein